MIKLWVTAVPLTHVCCIALNIDKRYWLWRY